MSRLDKKGRKLYPLVCENKTFVNELNKYFNWFSSVPDSCFKGIIPMLDPYFFSSRENHCVAMAFGAKIGGKTPCLFLQNSGLGLSLDSILGLFRLYKQGLVIFLSNRGELEWEEVQHKDWGEITIPMLEASKFDIIDFENEGLKSIGKAKKLADKNKVVFVIIHRGNFYEEN